MGASRHLTRARLNEILRRQNPPRFGTGYEPAIKATREEAPSISRPAWVWSEFLGRYISTLSGPERSFLPLALYSPALFELQEQRMLPFLPANHPLHGHPFAVGMHLPAFRGTISVADELGVFHFHPIIPAPRGDSSAEAQAVPGCWIGDFLFFLRDARGPYCVNVSVKDRRDAFRTPTIGLTPKTNLKRALQAEAARHLIEERLYRDVGIPTQQVAAEELDPIVVDNLQQLLLWQKRGHELDDERVEGIVEAFKDGLAAGASALAVIRALEVSEGLSEEAVKTVLYQAIWNRRLRIDLFRRFWLDEPMEPEVRDVLDVYGDFFRRPTA